MADHDDDHPAKPRQPTTPPWMLPSSRPAPHREPGAARSDSEPPSSDFAGEDFLFHLYRGSELLQDNCVEEAKEELERALSVQPRDPEGQALLGVVYFRLGLYPRAIEIYEELVRAFPREIAPRVNAGLCYLKTGQPLLARDFLEEVIRRVPDHKRAWGYLGLAYERLGDPAKALAAFERAGQTHLARRMEELMANGSPAPSEPPGQRAELYRAVADAVHELEEHPSPFEPAEATMEASSSRSGRWRAIELGREEGPPPSLRLRSSIPSPRTMGTSHPAAPADVPSLHHSEPPGQRDSANPPQTAALLTELSLIPLPHAGVSVLGDGVLVVRVVDSLSARLSAIRAMVTGGEPFRISPAYRRWRGRNVEEPLGGVSATLALLEGSGHVLLGSSPGARLVAVTLNEEFLYLREALLVAFDGALRYENGRLVRADGKQSPMVQLSGTGHAVFEVRTTVRALEVRAEQSVRVDAERVVGWTGRLLSRPPRTEPPALGLGGLAVFSGAGAVLLELG